MFVFEVVYVFSVIAMYQVFGYRCQKRIKMIGPTTCLRLDLGYGKAIFSYLLHVGPQVHFLDLLKTFTNYLCILLFIPHSFHSICNNSKQDNHDYYYTSHKNDHCNISFFSFICHWFLHNYRKRRIRTIPITTTNNPKTEIQIYLVGGH